MKFIVSIFFVSFLSIADSSYNSNATIQLSQKEIMLKKVNEIRTNGCYCGRQYMEPTNPLVWDDLLESSALNHAKEMSKYNFFAHFSKDGKDIGQRLDAVGYPWVYVGENIAEGQENFDEVLKDWIASRSHCKMLMNPKMKEMGIARYKNFWVQHFGAKQNKI